MQPQEETTQEVQTPVEPQAQQETKSYKEVMAYEPVLPEDFDGTFRFTNPSDEDFKGEWGSKEYMFPAGKTVPMIMPEFSPIEIQHIRKKFAKNLAEREFYKSQGYKTLRDQEGGPGNRTMTGIHQAGTYTLDDLAPYIQECLAPRELSKMTMKPVEKPAIEDKLHKDEDGKLISDVIDHKSKVSLVEKAKLND